MSYINLFLPFYNHLIISFFVWFTYIYVLFKGTWVSDDFAGIVEYDGKLQSWEYGTLWRWVRYHIVGGDFPSGKKSHDGKDIPQGKIPRRHHFLSILVFNISCFVAYQALTPIIGSKLALMAVLILVVHPCTTQGVAWISGLAYPLSLLWISLTIILMQWFYGHISLNTAMWVIPLFCLIQFFAIHAIFATTAMVWAILLFLGYWQFAILGFIVSGAMCFDQIRKTVSFRVEEFKKQHMAESTVINYRKYVVMFKTLFYYICHSLVPARMGLYHTFGFHYTKNIERRDRLFWAGFLSFCLLVCVFIKSDCLPIKFGILWYLVFFVGFSNLITAQQFITERYIMVANLGLGIIIATLTQNDLWIYTFILGAYISRTWKFLPTYNSELDFYKSNTWEFQKSEVAMGNLGVTCARLGLESSAKDTWLMATMLNQDYDVPWVNIFYQYRSKGQVMIQNGDYVGGMKQFQEGLPFLKKALEAKVCHFPEQWKKEYAEVFNSLSTPSGIFQGELFRLLRLKETLRNELSTTHDSKRVGEITESINNNEPQMDRLVEFFKANNFPVTDSTPFNMYHVGKTIEKLTIIGR